MKQDTIANCRNALYQILFYGVMIIYFILLFFLLFRKKAAGSFQSVNLIPFHSIGAYLFSDDMVSRAKKKIHLRQYRMCCIDKRGC